MESFFSRNSNYRIKKFSLSFSLLIRERISIKMWNTLVRIIIGIFTTFYFLFSYYYENTYFLENAFIQLFKITFKKINYSIYTYLKGKPLTFFKTTTFKINSPNFKKKLLKSTHEKRSKNE